jgi:hypothetical protein
LGHLIVVGLEKVRGGVGPQEEGDAPGEGERVMKMEDENNKKKTEEGDTPARFAPAFSYSLSFVLTCAGRAR